MKQVLLAIALATATFGVAQADPIQLQRPTDYGGDGLVPNRIKDECTINVQLPDYVGQYAKQNGLETTFVDKAEPGMKGRVLVMQILTATSAGNAFIGHHKSTTVKGALYQDGVLVGDFMATRNSMGGAFAGFKGSCSVLERTVKALGEDIGQWLKNPQMKSELGNY